MLNEALHALNDPQGQFRPAVCQLAANMHSIGLPGASGSCVAFAGRQALAPKGPPLIEEPPPIVFASSLERPSADIVERFRAPTSFIVHPMNGAGALAWRIKRLPGQALGGLA